MPHFCGVVECGHNSMRDWQKHFYTIPSEKNKRGQIEEHRVKRRQAWIQALHRDDLTESKIKNMRICSDHFVTGKPASTDEPDHVDYAPSLKMGYARVKSGPGVALRQQKRAGKRRKVTKEYSKGKLQDDVENFWQHKLLNNVHPKLKKGVIPHIFTCQTEKAVVIESRVDKQQLVEEAVQEVENKISKHEILDPVPSTSNYIPTITDKMEFLESERVQERLEMVTEKQYREMGIQVNIKHSCRSKATNTKIKVNDSATSPIKKITMSVQTSPPK